MEKIQMLERLDQLIKIKATGSPEELSIKLNISRSTVYYVIDCLKSLGADISYSNSKQSFIYNEEKKLIIGFISKNKIVQ